MSDNDTTRLKLTLTTKESDGEIPLLSDLTAEGDLDNDYPVAFQIPYQYAIGVIREEVGESSTVMKFLQPLKTNPDPFYHNGCSFSTVADSLNALRAYAQMHLQSPSPDIRDVLRVGRVYEVSLVFRTIGSGALRDVYTKDVVETVREKMKQAGISDAELLEFVRAEHKRYREEFTAEPEEDTSELTPVVENPTEEQMDHLEQSFQDHKFIMDLLGSTAKEDRRFVEVFFDVLDFYESCAEDQRINVKVKKTQKKIADWKISRLFSTAKDWIDTLDEMFATFHLPVKIQHQLNALHYDHTPLATAMRIIYRYRAGTWDERKPMLRVTQVKKNKKPS